MKTTHKNEIVFLTLFTATLISVILFNCIKYNYYNPIASL